MRAPSAIPRLPGQPAIGGGTASARHTAAQDQFAAAPSRARSLNEMQKGGLIKTKLRKQSRAKR